MSVSKRLGRVSQCAVSLIGVACLSVFANTERNGFIGVEGDAEFYKDGDDTIGIHNPIGAVEVVIEARDGWRFDDGTTKKNVDHEIGKTNDFVLVGRDGESSTKNYLVDDVEHIHESIVSEKHTDNAAIEPESAPDEIILVYAEPDYGVVVPSNCASWRIVQKATHTTTTKEIPCHMPECQWGNGTSSETVEIGPELSELVFSCDVPGAKDGLLTFGHYKIGYYASWTNRFCIEKECHAAAGTNSEISVFKVSVTNDQYIGLDMTDAGKDKYVVKNAKAKIEPTPSKGRYDVSYEWNTNPLCEIVEETKTRQEASYQNLSHKQASAAYQDQRLECQVTISAKDSQRYGSATCTNNFTVVKVDVEIEMPDAKNAEENESIEETQGAYLYYIPDSNSWWTVEASNNLRKVKFRYWPEDLPKEQTVTIEADSELLYELKDRKYQPAKKNYTLKELGERDFVLHAHRRSEKYLGEEIRFTHDLSQAVDVAKYTIFGRPLLVPDYDRDGKIDEEDDARAQDGKTVFRFWINNDDDRERDSFFSGGDGWYSDQALNVPEGGSNQRSSSISGYCDLEDFTPVKVAIDPGCIFPKETPDELKNGIKWKLKSSCAGIVWTKLARENANDYLKKPYSDFGPNQNEDSYDASIVRLSNLRDGKEIPKKVHTFMKSHGNYVIVLMEGLAEGEDFEIVGERTVQKKKTKFTMGSCPIKIGYAEEMYRWMDLRSCLGEGKANPTNTRWENEPRNGPDSDCNGLPRGNRHWVFAHGFNVNTQEARGWAATVFKRLWQTGDNSWFTFVNWAGDAGQFRQYAIAKGYWSLDYYRNSENAFNTASNLAVRCNALTEKLANVGATKTYLMGHSLGNVLMSEAIASFGLRYSRYYMLNAAVPMQAYDASVAEDALMIHPDWRALSKKSYRASGWHALFGEDDFRSTLCWPGRYSTIKNKYNVYSESDDRLKNIEVKEDDDFMLSSVWVLQERMKGTWKATLSNVADKLYWKIEENAGVACEGGWGVNTAEYGKYYDGGVLIKAAELPRERLVQIPLFTPFENRDSRLNDLALFKNDPKDDDQYRLRAVLLSDAIPATTYAAGANNLTCADKNTNLEKLENNSLKKYWPRKNENWLHSDIKNVSYLLTRGFYEFLLKDE